jgi:hypothetical protein
MIYRLTNHRGEGDTFLHAERNITVCSSVPLARPILASTDGSVTICFPSFPPCGSVRYLPGLLCFILSFPEQPRFGPSAGRRRSRSLGVYCAWVRGDGGQGCNGGEDGERTVDGSVDGGGMGVGSRALDRWIDSSGSPEWMILNVRKW